MNKKVSTLLTVALTLGGSLLSSSAFATDVTATSFANAVKNGVLDVKTLAPDNVINLTQDVNLAEGQHLVIVKEDGVTITSKDGKTFKGHLLLAGDGITVSNLKLTSKDLLSVVRQGNWNSSIISVYANNVTIKGNTFEGAANRSGAFNEAISLVPQSNEVNYVVEGNEFSGFTTDMGDNNKLNTAIRINRGSNWMAIQVDDPNKTNLENAFNDSKLKGINNDVIGAGPSAYPGMSIESIVKGNEFETTTSNVILSGFDGDDVAEISFNELDEAAEEVLKKIATDQNNKLSYNAQLYISDAEPSEVVDVIEEVGLKGDYVIYANNANIVDGEGYPNNDNPCISADGVEYLSSAELNDVNRGSFSIGYQFDKNNKATENPFDRELKAFRLEGEATMVVYLATSWPESLNNKSVISKDEFNDCDFLVAAPSTDVNEYYNIAGHNKFGESVKFVSVKGDRLTSDIYPGNDVSSINAAKAGKYAFVNAQFRVVNDATCADEDAGDYKFTMPNLYGLSDNNKKVKASEAVATVALIGTGKDRIVTTTFATEDANKLCVHASIGNTRTVEAKDFLSTEKASVFNIKFVSKTLAGDLTGNEANTKSEYNKYLTVYGNETLAHGSDFTNLSAPESQWIVVDVTADGEFVFQNRENAEVKITVELLSTDKDNVYELRSTNDDELALFAYVDGNGEYKRYGGKALSGMSVELTAVTPNKEAGYASTELDNAGLVRFVFNRNEESDVQLSDFYVTVNSDNAVKVDKEESKAAQFSVIKFDASSTSTALADSIYADNNYVIWNASDKKTEMVEDGDSIAVVAYAFKQLRADGKNYYLNADMQLTKFDDEADAPRFLVKLYKNGSYGLLSVDRTSWNRGDYFREILEENSDILTLNNNAAIEGSTSVYYDYTTSHLFDFNILKETPGTSFNHVPQHVTMEAVNGGYIAMNAENKEGIVAPVSTLKAEYTKEDLTFWLDTTDSEAVTPSFMISKAGNYMYNAVDSLNAYNDGTASAEKAEDFGMKVNNVEYAKAIFQTADLTKVGDINNYKFQIVQSADNADEYVIKSLNGYKYVAAHNQKLYFTAEAKDALKVIVTRVEAPTSNEGVSATEVKVVANNGSVVVKNAAGKNVVVSTILGQVVANEVLTSDNATINVPAGIVVVAVEGESFKVNVK